VDSEGFPDTIVGVITQPHQFAGYNAGHPATSEIKELVEDVLNRWMAEKDGEDSVGRVLLRSTYSSPATGK
jgi:spore germination cell wall hydrolase CwlJ-like protein